jgi:hypothetical protein
VSQGLGSAIVFPFYHSDGGDTLFTIRNSHPSTSVKVQLYYVCEDTGNTIKVNLTVPAGGSATSLASSVDPDCAGYMIAVAKNTSTGFPINFNYLSGTAYITMDGYSGTFPGYTVKALTMNWPPSGNLKSTGARVIAPFDGVNYEFLPGPVNGLTNLVLDNIKQDSIIAISSVSGDLTNIEGVDSLRNISATLITKDKNLSLYINQPGLVFYGTVSELFPAVSDLNSFIGFGKTKLILNTLTTSSLFGLVIQTSGEVDRKVDETKILPDSSYLGVPLV